MKKFFTEKQIYVATAVAGPITAGILIFKNLKRLGDKRNANIALIMAFTFTISLFYGLMQLPDSINIPDAVFPLLYTGLIYLYYRRDFARAVQEKLESAPDETKKASVISVVGISILGLVVGIAIVLSIAFLEPPYPGEKYSYRDTGNEIYYDEGEVSEQHLLILGDELTRLEFFQAEAPAAVRVDVENGLHYLYLNVDKSFWTDQEFLNSVNELKDYLSDSTDKPYFIKLEHYNFSGKSDEKVV